MKRILLFFIFLCFFLFVYFDRYQPVSLDAVNPTTKMVEIKGAVNNPGVYTVKWESTIQDVIKAAGGLQKNANTDSLNLVKKVRNGDVIVVKKDVEQESKKISLNSATLSELDSLPGVGPSIAQRIIDYRKEHSFQTVEQIKEVKGIGDKLFEKIKEQIVL